MESSKKEQLKSFLNDIDIFSNENDVIGFMVNLRKLIDKENEIENCKEKDYFKFVKFYCDWTVHNEKSGNTDIVKEIINNIIKEIETNKRKQAVEFIYADELRKNIKKTLFDIYKKEFELTKYSNDRNITLWLSFIYHLSNVLEEQPIKINGSEKLKILTENQRKENCCLGEDIFLYVNGKKINSVFTIYYPNRIR